MKCIHLVVKFVHNDLKYEQSKKKPTIWEIGLKIDLLPRGLIIETYSWKKCVTYGDRRFIIASITFCLAFSYVMSGHDLIMALESPGKSHGL